MAIYSDILTILGLLLGFFVFVPFANGHFTCVDRLGNSLGLLAALLVGTGSALTSNVLSVFLGIGIMAWGIFFYVRNSLQPRGPGQRRA